ncbi:hypothetical protein GALMADRAFT_65751 [Galerina marginata CBS 339.88]|uniref:Pali-domain-containing protein n=1 Tax=Galerina marginata (strain CBS 339.88) TaxID=685588 RepID=A0A067T511_GALM3|nr:hypothetical protein GALMADRAFT_65751 [Galerina marginata CBS 339.88]
MARTTPIHHVGTFLIFAAAVLLLITTITAPVVKDFAMLKVTLTNSSAARHSSVTFGTFGHCVLDVAPAATDQDSCSGRSIGYSPMKIMEDIDHADYNTASVNTADALTRVQILHPIACAIAFIAFFFSIGAGICGSVLASMTAVLAWIITLVVLITDFVSWGIVKDHVNKDGSGSHAAFGTGMWTELGAMVALFFGAFLVFCSCCGARRRSNRGMNGSVGEKPAYAGTGRRRRFWQRKY